MDPELFKRKMARLLRRAHNTGLVFRDLNWRGDGTMLIELYWAPGKSTYICEVHPSDYQFGKNNFTWRHSQPDDHRADSTVNRLCRLAQDVAHQVIVQGKTVRW